MAMASPRIWLVTSARCPLMSWSVGRLVVAQPATWSGEPVSRPAYEDTLAGRPQRYLRIIEAGGTVLRELAGAAGSPPSDVTLTIDRDMQEITAQALADAVSYAVPNWGGITAGGAIVALDVHSGAVLALASYPSFDPHIFNPDTLYNIGNAILRLDRDIRQPFVNKALAEQYTPGSVYKIVTTLARRLGKDLGAERHIRMRLYLAGR